MKQQLARLDRVASDINGWLLAIVIGLAVLDLSVLTDAILAGRIAVVRVDPAEMEGG